MCFNRHIARIFRHIAIVKSGTSLLSSFHPPRGVLIGIHDPVCILMMFGLVAVGGWLAGTITMSFVRCRRTVCFWPRL